jgi:hypothetical protein
MDFARTTEVRRMNISGLGYTGLGYIYCTGGRAGALTSAGAGLTYPLGALIGMLPAIDLGCITTISLFSSVAIESVANG